MEQRDHHDHSLFIERPKSLSVGGPKLISLEEAQTRRSGDSSAAISKAMAIATPASNAIGCGTGGNTSGAVLIGSGGLSAAASGGNTSSSYIEVGGGPSSLPDKYHTVLPVPRSWSKRKTHSWKSLFTRNQQRSSGAGDLPKHAGKKTLTISHPCPLDGGASGGIGAGAGGLALERGSLGAMVQSTTVPSKTATTTHISLRNGHENQLLAAKSIDVFDDDDDDDGISCSGNGTKAPLMDLCLMRSASIDSLRTVGHSRSVSHDSYFDLLQSPLRSGAAGTCGLPGGGTTAPAADTNPTAASRAELCELGLNFDREEPEMRIFSESESLVSSPRPMGKEVRSHIFLSQCATELILI